MSGMQELKVDKEVELTCPHCGGRFFHKVGHFLKQAGVTIVETAAAIFLAGKGGTE